MQKESYQRNTHCTKRNILAAKLTPRKKIKLHVTIKDAALCQLKTKWHLFFWRPGISFLELRMFENLIAGSLGEYYYCEMFRTVKILTCNAECFTN